LERSNSWKKGGEKTLKARGSGREKKEPRKSDSTSTKESIATGFGKEEESRKENKDSITFTKGERFDILHTSTHPDK
jgi:hypothetical protein